MGWNGPGGSRWCPCVAHLSVLVRLDAADSRNKWKDKYKVYIGTCLVQGFTTFLARDKLGLAHLTHLPRLGDQSAQLPMGLITLYLCREKLQVYH